MSLGRNQKRRKLLGVGLLAPTLWTKPVVETVLLPAHAQTSALPEDDDDGGGNGPNCDYKVYTGCEFSVIELCNHGGNDCNVESIKFELFYTDDPSGTPGGAAIHTKTFDPLSSDQCKTFENLWNSSDVGAWQGVFTFSPSGETLRSQVCRQEGDLPPQDECKGTRKIENNDIGVAPQQITLGDYSFTITGWTEKGDSPGEYVGFTLDKPACFAVKSGLNTVNDCGTSWINPNGTSGSTAKAISNITFSCPPED